METVAILFAGGVVLWLGLVLDARASRRTARATTRSRSFQPHARRVTRSSYMAHPQEVDR
jgi:hypothetical protein